MRLGARGYQVTVLEKLDAPGGRAYVHRQGLHLRTLARPSSPRPTCSTNCGRCAAEIAPTTSNCASSIRSTRCASTTATCRLPETSTRSARRLPASSRATSRRSIVSWRRARIYDIAFGEYATKPFHDFGTFSGRAVDPVRLGGYRSVQGFVSRYFRNDKLRILFSFHPLLVGGNPFTTTSFYRLISHLERTYGVHWAMGGTGAPDSRGLAKLVAGQGGTLRCGAEVAQITHDGRRATGVRLASGETLPADIVVSNADAAWTYSRMLGDHPRRRWTDAKLRALCVTR